MNLHVLGEPPPEKLVVPWLVTCLGAGFLDRLGEVVPSAGCRPNGRKPGRNSCERKARRLLRHFLVEGWSAEDALRAVGGNVTGAPPPRLVDDLRRANQLRDGFAKTPQEIDNLLAALERAFHSARAGKQPRPQSGRRADRPQHGGDESRRSPQPSLVGDRQAACRATAGATAKDQRPLSGKSRLYAQPLRHFSGLWRDGIADPLLAGRPPAVGRPQPGGRRGIDSRRRTEAAPHRRFSFGGRLLPRHAPHPHAADRQGDPPGRRFG